MTKFQLHGSMIPRTVKRLFDQRSEPRLDVSGTEAVLGFRGRDYLVPLINVSSSGAMVRFPTIPRIGEAVTLQMLDRGLARGQVRWVRDGRIGISIDRPAG